MLSLKGFSLFGGFREVLFLRHFVRLPLCRECSRSGTINSPLCRRSLFLSNVLMNASPKYACRRIQVHNTEALHSALCRTYKVASLPLLGPLRGRTVARKLATSTQFHHSERGQITNVAVRDVEGDITSRTEKLPGGIEIVDVTLDQVEQNVKYQIKRNMRYTKALLVFVVAGGIAMYLSYAATDVSSAIYRSLDGLLGICFNVLPDNFPDPEFAHKAVMWLASRGVTPLDLERDDPSLEVNIKGLVFSTPVGLGAGFDKGAEAVLPFWKMGFGFVEVGTITPKAQGGNPVPRIFRLPEDRAVINRCGFNSEGIDVVEPRLKMVSKDRWEDRLARRGVLGVNVGKNKDTVDAERDIREGVARLGRYADYLVINLSSPNTQGLRDLQARNHLKSIIGAAQDELLKLERQAEEVQRTSKAPTGVDETGVQDSRLKAYDFFPTQTGRRPLLFVKIAPDLSDQQKKDIAEVALEMNLDGLIVTNTTVQRPDSLKSRNRNETGGLSGRPLKEMSTLCVSDIYKLTGGKIPIIACGGVETGLDAFKKITAGASAVEVYTSMVYRGPIVARRIKDELHGILNQAGINSIGDAIGLDHRPRKRVSVPKPTFD